MNSSSYRPTLSGRFVADALHLEFTGKPKQDFTSIVTDSRKVEPGCLFVAIAGDSFDGHQFIPQAIAAGALGLVCRKDFRIAAEDLRDAQLYLVDDTLSAYRRLGAAWRREFSLPIVVVAGSAGKTTTKELLAAILHGKWPELLKTSGSQNGFLGIPMTLLQIRSEHRMAVIEVGIDEIGAMKEHIQLINPSAAVLTNVGPEHMEKLLDIPTVAREEGLALTMVANANGLVAINLDDPWIRPHSSTIRTGKRLTYSLSSPPPPTPLNEKGEVKTSGRTEQDLFRGELTARDTHLRVRGTAFGQSFDGEFQLPLLGQHNAANLLAAVTLAAGLGMTPQEIQAGLKTFTAAEGRSQIRKLIQGTTVVCDYYNAQPPAMVAGLQLLSEVAGRSVTPGARWACLADMLELGLDEEKYHRALAETIRKLGIEHVLLYGERMKWLQDELKIREFPNPVSHFGSQDEMARSVLGKLQPQDTVLIKGSRGMRMEEVWKVLERQAK